MSDQLKSDTTRTADRIWMVPFFAVIVGGIGFFFLQLAQYGLLLGH